MNKLYTRFIFQLFVISLMFYAGVTNGQVKITVFQPSTPSTTAIGPRYSKGTKRDSLKFKEKNCIKWNYSLLLRGVALFNYEFLLTDNLTGEVGLGLTYRDFIYDMMNIESSTPVNLDYTPNAHVCGEFGVRYYPQGFNDMEGFYLSPMISYRPYSFSPPSSNNYSYNGMSNTTTANLTTGYNFLDLQFKVGYQAETVVFDIMRDFYTGIGYRSVSSTFNYTDANGNIKQATASKGYPTFLLGFKMGFPF